MRSDYDSGTRLAFPKYGARGAYHWRELARRTPTAYSARLHALYGWFLDEADERRPARIADVGCGDAALAHLLAERTGARVVGIEPDATGVELAREALRAADSPVEVVRARGEDLPLPDRSVSLVVLCEVIEHVEVADPLLEQAARVVDDDGAVLISTPQHQGGRLRPHHVREYAADELDSLCRRFFASCAVYVANPPFVHDGYTRSRSVRVAVNLASLVGVNPFAVRRPATPGRQGWRQLLAVATRPHHS